MERGAFDGKTVFVTGGSGAIGGACAEAIVRDGAAALLMGRGLEALEGTRRGILERVPGAQVELFAGDAMDEDEVKAGLAAARDLRGSLDVVIPTVGGGAIRPLLMHDKASFQETLDLNMMSAFLAVRHAAPIMAKNGGGAIVCISSDAAASDEIQTIAPPPFFAMIGAACRTARNALIMFRSSVSWKLALSCISRGRIAPPPTVGITTSSDPRRSRAAARPALTSSSSIASPAKSSTCAPGTRSRIPRRVPSSASSPRPIKSAAAPSRTIASAHAPPIAPEPPVTKTVFPSNAPLSMGLPLICAA